MLVFNTANNMTVVLDWITWICYKIQGNAFSWPCDLYIQFHFRYLFTLSQESGEAGGLPRVRVAEGRR